MDVQKKKLKEMIEMFTPISKIFLWGITLINFREYVRFVHGLYVPRFNV